jgi:hypothetical protein
MVSRRAGTGGSWKRLSYTGWPAAAVLLFVWWVWGWLNNAAETSGVG